MLKNKQPPTNHLNSRFEIQDSRFKKFHAERNGMCNRTHNTIQYNTNNTNWRDENIHNNLQYLQQKERQMIYVNQVGGYTTVTTGNGEGGGGGVGVGVTTATPLLLTVSIRHFYLVFLAGAIFLIIVFLVTTSDGVAEQCVCSSTPEGMTIARACRP